MMQNIFTSKIEKNTKYKFNFFIELDRNTAKRNIYPQLYGYVNLGNIDPYLYGILYHIYNALLLILLSLKFNRY